MYRYVKCSSFIGGIKVQLVPWDDLFKKINEGFALYLKYKMKRLYLIK